MQKKGFGGLFKRLRKDAGIGIKKLAPHLGVTYSYLSKLENGSTLPSEELVYRTARYFSCDPNPLMLAAGKVPRDVLKILQENPEDAFEFLKDRFGGGGNASKQRS
jgi:HTH-type transcriptional regulator, competence development regulator